MNVIIKFVPLLSLIVFIVEMLIDTNSVLYPVSYIPLLFGLLHLFVLKPEMFRGPGIKVAYFVMIIRYLYNPIMLINSSYFAYYEMISMTMYKSVVLMAIEMITIVLTIAFYKRNKIIETESLKKEGYSYIVPLLFLLISIVWSIKDPVPISRYHSILSGATELFDTDLEEADRGLPRMLSYTHKLLVTSLIVFFYVWYNKKRGNNRIFRLGLIVVVVITCFYTDQSRNSLFLPLLTVMFLFNKIYKDRQKAMNLFFVTVIVLSVGYLTLLKQFHTTSYNSSLLNKRNSSLMMERYFAGTTGVYECVKYKNVIVNKINKTTLLTETFGNMMFVGRMFNKENRTSVFYNNAVGSHSFIIPTICESYFHFGWLLCWLMPFVIIKLILYFDKLFLTSSKIDISFVFGFISVSMGWVHGGNFIICMTNLHKGLTLLVFYLINDYIGKKVKF